MLAKFTLLCATALAVAPGPHQKAPLILTTLTTKSKLLGRQEPTAAGATVLASPAAGAPPEATESGDDDLFEKKKKKELPANLSEYCAAGKNMDPACDVNAPVKALKDEISDVFKHIREMIAKKNDLKKKPAEEEHKADHEAEHQGEHQEESDGKPTGENDTSKNNADGEGTGKGKESGTGTDEKSSGGAEADKKNGTETAPEDEDHEKEKEQKHATGAINTEEEREHILHEEQHIEEHIGELETVEDQLEKDGKLDRELAHEIGNLISDAKNMRDNFKKLEDADDDEAMLEALEKLEEETRKTAASLKSLSTGVAPNEWKWWRYRYEYSFVESACLICVVLLAMLLDLGHHSVQTRIFEPEAQRRWATFQTASGSNVMKRRWLCLLFGELSVLGLVQFFIWLSAHLDLFSVIPTKSLYLPGMHLPRNEEEYLGVVKDVFVHLFISIIMYYLLVGTIMRASERKIELWEACQPVDTPRDNVPMKEKEQFGMLQRYFTDCLLQDTKLWADCGSPRGDNMNNVPFVKYLSWCVRDRVEDHLCIRTHMWFGIALTLTVFCAMNYYHVAFLQITAVMTVFVFVCIGLMGLQIHRIKRSIHKYQELPTKEKQSGSNSSCMTGGDFYMAKLFQFFLFFTCYGCARIVASPFMWTLYPILASALVGSFILFYCLFVMVLSEVFPEFAALMSIPPYVGTDKAIQFSSLLNKDAARMLRHANSLGLNKEGAVGTFNLDRPVPGGKASQKSEKTETPEKGEKK